MTVSELKKALAKMAAADLHLCAVRECGLLHSSIPSPNILSLIEFAKQVEAENRRLREDLEDIAFEATKRASAHD